MPGKLILICTAIVVASFFALISVFYIFKVKNISIHADYPCASDEEIATEIKKTSGSIFSIQSSQLKDFILKKFTCIDKVNVTTKLPSTLEISYTGKNPVAKVDSSDIYLTASGLALKIDSLNKSLPTIFLPQAAEALEGAKISDANALLALEITNLLLKSDFVPTNVRIVNDSITVYNQQDSVVIFSTKKPANVQTDSLQKVLAKAKMESKKISKIDMRFDNPTIVFN